MPERESNRQLLVAIVDDDDGVCAGMARLLRAAGMDVVTFGTAEGLLAAPRLASVDALVLDVRLPGMNGLELQRRLQERGVKVPVVFVSANDDPKTRLEARRQGCAAFFGKTHPGCEVIAALLSSVASHQHSLGAAGRAP